MGSSPTRTLLLCERVRATKLGRGGGGGGRGGRRVRRDRDGRDVATHAWGGDFGVLRRREGSAAVDGHDFGGGSGMVGEMMALHTTVGWEIVGHGGASE